MDIFAIIAISFLCFVLVVLAIFVLICAGFSRMSFSRKGTAAKIANRVTDRNKEAYLIDHDWWQRQKVEELSITSFDGLKLYGFFIDNKSDKLAILVHGYARDHKDFNSYAQMFLKRGFCVLAVDCRAHGKSEGNTIGMGWLDRLDLKQWIEFMVQKNSAYKIVLFGQSMGAATVCMTLGENLPNNVICAISDCAFDNVYREFYHVGRGYLKFATKPLLNALNSYLKRGIGFDIKRADAISQLKKSRVPILFIHGNADNFVPVEMCHHLSEAIPPTRREVLIVEGAGHSLSYATQPKEYEKAVDRFIKKINLL